MPPASPSHPTAHRLSCHYWSGDALRSRSVSPLVRSGTLDVPAPSARLVADWQRETLQNLQVAPGEVEQLPLARARLRWPDYKPCVQAMADWTRGLGLADILGESEIALMTCRGAKYHHDVGQYGGAAFCNLFMSEDKGLDLHFPHAGVRIPLVRGTAVLFDTGQPHAVIKRHSNGFDAADFAPEHDATLVFLTWELPIEEDSVARALQLAFDVSPAPVPPPNEEQLWRDGAPAQVDPGSGQWRPAQPD
ncbi:hypothetical protein [Variovorax sp. HJSM1_2]|uniref:hypothetical protein n=1 Tax=Variovorax sp. HJSM1_2 TaxID=3366263 RepID=UPI003BDED4A6